MPHRKQTVFDAKTKARQEGFGQSQSPGRRVGPGRWKGGASKWAGRGAMHLKQRSLEAKTIALHEGQSQSPGRRGLSFEDEGAGAATGAGS